MNLRAVSACALLALACGCAGPQVRPAEAPAAPAADPAPAATPEIPAAPAATAPSPAAAPASSGSDAPRPRSSSAEQPASDRVGDPSAPLADGRAVFATLRAQLASEGCSEDRVVARWLDRYARAPEPFARQLRRVLPLLAHVLERVRGAGLPGEFALLPIVESWYRADARHAGTAGLWQFSAPTARAYGLRVDAQRDQRLEPGPATDAALAHLADLLSRFGDWRLAVMAYNAGEYRLARAHAADPAPPSPGGHRPAGLPLGTYEHLAKLQALACLVLAPQRIGLLLPEDRFAPPGAQVLQAQAPAATPNRTQDAYVVRAGDSLWTIARRHGLALSDLLRWNRLEASAVLQPGQRIRLTP